MGKTPGFIQFVCDRCPASDYAPDNSPTAQKWQTIERYNASGNVESRVLCPSCSKLYNALVVDQDIAFDEFMNPESAAV